jgi:Mrp family chromosome partitioning ATPase
VVDGVLLCVGAGQALREEVAACVERLAMVDAKLLGAVLNRIHREGGRYRNRYDYHYGYGSQGSHGSTEPQPEPPVEPQP